MIGQEDVRRRLAGMISGLDVRYDVGGPAHPLLGARLPCTEVRARRRLLTTTHLVRSGGGVLLDLTGQPGRPAGSPRRLGGPRHRTGRPALAGQFTAGHRPCPGPPRRPRGLG
ncbi:hypothetical protein R2F25_37885 [Streptomyces sp. UP1A-1]|nr:hypothetical protein [Streptomyces sp. UP1A-1]